jgi:phosphopantetheinyl transferase
MYWAMSREFSISPVGNNTYFELFVRKTVSRFSLIEVFEAQEQKQRNIIMADFLLSKKHPEISIMPYYLYLSVLSRNLNNQQEAGAKYKKRLSAEARRILSRIEGRHLTEGDIAREPSGRPFFANKEIHDRDIDFSISHSGDLVVVSLARGKNLRTGCDVELVRPRTRAREIAKDFFTAPEIEYIESEGRFDENRFYEIWTLKECFLKLRGLSIFDMAGVPSFISGDGLYRFVFDAEIFSPLSFSLYELSGRGRYILAVALEGTEIEQPEIRWFSHDFPDCKSIVNIKAALSPADTVKPKI